MRRRTCLVRRIGAAAREDGVCRLWYIAPRMSTNAGQGGGGLTEEDVRKVATLARLALLPDEIVRMTAELSAIVSYVQKLAELDTTNVAPTAHVRLARAPLRADAPRPGLSHDEALAEAPRVGHDGFAVPAFVDD
jgi:aspartyl-tRNA(Asn)/glutamyl-tRNA(Gln) amidotransferase subunit C